MSTTLAVKGVRKEGIKAEILSFDAGVDDQNILETDYTHFVSGPAVAKIAYSRSFSRFLENRQNYDLYHCQGIWQYPTFITARLARKWGKPYVITPRGMLYPQQLKSSELHKHIAFKLYQMHDLQNAACIHATCSEELRHLRDLGITTPVAVIPNPIEADGLLEQQVPSPDKMRFGYLGRVHPRKNIERLLYAWHRLGREARDRELVIIGAGEDEYYRFLKEEARRLDLGNVRFTGFLSGNEKELALASLSYLVVPSDFENFGMIVAEALVRGIPVIASKGTPWQDLENRGCGWWVDNDVETITEMMKEAMELPEEQRQAMGRNGKQLIAEKYTVEKVGKKLAELYEWTLKRATKPDFVFNQ